MDVSRTGKIIMYVIAGFFILAAFGMIMYLVWTKIVRPGGQGTGGTGGTGGPGTGTPVPGTNIPPVTPPPAPVQFSFLKNIGTGNIVTVSTDNQTVILVPPTSANNNNQWKTTTVGQFLQLQNKNFQFVDFDKSNVPTTLNDTPNPTFGVELLFEPSSTTVFRFRVTRSDGTKLYLADMTTAPQPSNLLTSVTSETNNTQLFTFTTSP